MSAFGCRSTITENWDLEQKDERDLSIDKGKLHYFFFSYEGDENAPSLGSISDEGLLRCRMNCEGNPGAYLEHKENDASDRDKWIYVLFPDHLESGYPCEVVTTFSWPRFWNHLREKRSDEVIFTTTNDVEHCEVIVVFPKGIDADRIGVMQVPYGNAQVRTSKDGNAEIFWGLSQPSKGQNYVIRFTIHEEA